MVAAQSQYVSDSTMDIYLISSILLTIAGGTIIVAYGDFARSFGWPVGTLFQKTTWLTAIGFIGGLGALATAIIELPLPWPFVIIIAGWFVAFLFALAMKSWAQFGSVLMLVAGYALLFFVADPSNLATKISSDFLDRAPLGGAKQGMKDPSEANAATAVSWLMVNASSVNMRGRPNADAPIVAKLMRRTHVQSIAQSGSWRKVYDPQSGNAGWIHERYLSQANSAN